MSNNNDSGGGCLLWFIDFIFSRIRNKRIKKYNKQARGIEEHRTLPVSVLFPSHTYDENIIISGGSQGERLNICEAILRNAYNNNHSVIILHTANGAMENLVARNGFGTVISDRNKLFDAFVSFDFNEIFQTITDTCKSKYDIKPVGRYILQIAYELLVNMKRTPYFSAFANCPYFKLYDQIEACRNAGTMANADADRLGSLLLTGQIECPKIDTFFSDMKAQISYLSAPNPNIVKAVSILSAIMNNEVLCIDIRSSTNIMFLELIVNSLIVAMNKGYSFSLLIDDIPFVNNDILKNTICQKSNHNNIILSKDLYTLTGGKEDVFSSLIGEVEKTILFGHSSNISCEKWSKYIGEYEKIDVSYNSSGGWSQSSNWGYSSQNGQRETLKREHKVKPEQINSLSQNEAFVYDNTTGSLIQTVIS